ncbi:Tudor domain-containing protein [Meloidogyne graminicola]|uniref:Tudor domain-containing protein n=1 Tax=Meloidogyne graminicola TaxID=189291 RepID=A0A8S9ZDZ3_9BILA|nr:Tudor domain-containing protein [Meloidogyne graminicola]
MIFQEDSSNDRIEETRELLYKIIKNNFTTKVYQKNWIDLLRVAEEFHVQDVSTYTLFSIFFINFTKNSNFFHYQFLSNGNIAKQQKICCESECLPAPIISKIEEGLCKSEENNKPENKESKENNILTPISAFMSDQFEPVALDTLPTIGPVEILINVYCEYLNSSLLRLPPPMLENNVLPGQVFCTQIEGDWCRVQLIKKSTANPQYWVVYVVDAGFFYAVHKMELRPLTEAVTSFKRRLLLNASWMGSVFEVRNKRKSKQNGQWYRIQWLPETQHFVNEALQPNRLRDKLVELILTSEWKLHNEKRIPVCTGKLFIDSTDFAEQLVAMGLAQRKKNKELFIKESFTFEYGLFWDRIGVVEIKIPSHLAILNLFETFRRSCKVQRHFPIFKMKGSAVLTKERSLELMRITASKPVVSHKWHLLRNRHEVALLGSRIERE